jgi:hypothetical protein
MRPLHNVLWHATNEVKAFQHDLVVEDTANTAKHSTAKHTLGEANLPIL